MSAPVSTWLDVRPDHVPERIRRVPKWVGWRAEERADTRTGEMRLTKVPFRIAEPSRTASVDAPETWGSFEDAVEAYGVGVFDGIGYVLTIDDPVMGVDLDACRDPETGLIETWAAAIVARLRSYTEISPSGRGLRVFLIGLLPGPRRRKGSIELYEDGRYLTVTGHHLAGMPTTIEIRLDELDALYADVFPEPATANGHQGRDPEPGEVNLDDEDLLRRARAASNGADFDRLWAGDASAHDSHSEADLALCSMLAFWTGRDAARMDRLFRRSGLMRDKWDERRGEQTYGARTIATAIAGCHHVYGDGAPGHRDRRDDGDRDRADGRADGRADDHARPSPAAAPAPTARATSPPGFIAQYVEIALRRTDAPEEAHQLAAVAVLSALAGPRVRLKLAYRADGVRLVIWAMNVVDSTSGRKTTVNEFGLDVARQVLGEDAVLPWKGSPEAFIQAFAARDGQAAVFARDEYSGLLKQMKKGGYVAGLAQDFIRAYDGLPIVMARTAKMNKNGDRVDDSDRVRDPYLVKLCAATRTSFIETATIEDVLDGLLARFVFTTGSAEEQRIRPMTRELEDAWRRIVAEARAYHERAADVLTVAVPERVLDLEWTLEKDLKAAALVEPRPDAARPAMKRLAETTLKVASLLALERASAGSAEVTEADFEAAARLAAPWQRTTLGLIADLGRTLFQSRCDRVLGTIRAKPKGITLSSLYLAHRDLKGREFEEVVGALETQHLIYRVEAKTGKPGRTPIVFFPGAPTEPA
jgi:putative DNA primase/helicase